MVDKKKSTSSTSKNNVKQSIPRVTDDGRVTANTDAELKSGDALMQKLLGLQQDNLTDAEIGDTGEEVTEPEKTETWSEMAEEEAAYYAAEEVKKQEKKQMAQNAKITVKDVLGTKETATDEIDMTTLNRDQLLEMAKRLAAEQKALKELAKQQREKEKKDKEAKKSAKVVAATPEDFRFTHVDPQYIAEDGTIEVPLARLVKMDVTGIPGIKYAMREIDENNVYQMLMTLEAGKPLPPMHAQPSSKGYVVWDGGHRTEAYTRFLKATLEDSGIADQFAAHAETLGIKIIPSTFTKPRELKKAGFEANKENGMGMSQTSRTRLAIFYLECAKEDGEKLTQEEAARMAGCSRTAVTRQLLRDNKKDPDTKMKDILTSEEDLEATLVEAEKIDEKAETDALAAASARLANAVKTIFDLVGSKYEIAKYFREKEFFKPEDSQAMATVFYAMEEVRTSLPAPKEGTKK